MQLVLKHYDELEYKQEKVDLKLSLKEELTKICQLINTYLL